MGKVAGRGWLAVGIVTLLLAGCGSSSRNPTPADLMRGHADDAQSLVQLKNQLADDWEKGAKMVAIGEKQIKEGEQLITKGQDLVTRGTRELTEGRRLMEESERIFQENFPNLHIWDGE